jgi:hypothetical protein
MPEPHDGMNKYAVQEVKSFDKTNQRNRNGKTERNLPDYSLKSSAHPEKDNHGV